MLHHGHLDTDNAEQRLQEESIIMQTAVSYNKYIQMAAPFGQMGKMLLFWTVMLLMVVSNIISQGWYTLMPKTRRLIE